MNLTIISFVSVSIADRILFKDKWYLLMGANQSVEGTGERIHEFLTNTEALYYRYIIFKV